MAEAAYVNDAAAGIPLVVGLDGTLVFTDTLLESIFVLAKRDPVRLLSLPLWAIRGRAYFKHRLAQNAVPDAATLPYNQTLLAYIKNEKISGRRIVLATGADGVVAARIAAHLGLFDMVFASDGRTNLTGARKQETLLTQFGSKGFDYAANGLRDRPTWHAARKAILVGHSPHAAAAETAGIDRVFESRSPSIGTYLRAIRLHHWFKNILVFLPLLAAHKLFDPGLLEKAGAAFLAFCLCASSIYLLNDLIDMSGDRLDPHKRMRVLASGQIPIANALLLIPILVLGAFIIGLSLSPAFLPVLGAYYFLMVAYCLVFRKLVVVDAMVLAIGYSCRFIGGAIAVGVVLSPYLLAFCLLLFFGLAMLKRFAELRSAAGDETVGHSRGYRPAYRNVVLILGCSATTLAVLILALQVAVEQCGYPRHQFIWVLCGLLQYWLAYIWFMAARGQVSGDPVTFALRQRTSQFLFAVMGAAALAAA
ncbi:MAG: UbiA family prenyltransferase [Rhodospirillaceae bacterium]